MSAVCHVCRTRWFTGANYDQQPTCVRSDCPGKCGAENSLSQIAAAVLAGREADLPKIATPRLVALFNGIPAKPGARL